MSSYKISRNDKDKNVFTIHIYQLRVENIEEFKEIFKPYRDKKYTKIILDFCGTSYISPEIIGLLLDYKAKLISNNGLLIINVDSIYLRDELKEVQLDKIIPICETLEQCYKIIDWEGDEVSEKVKLSFTPDIHLIPSIRNLASRLSKIKGFSDAESYRIQTVIDELCTNAVEHGYWKPGDKVRVSMHFSKTKIELFVHSAIEPTRIGKLQNVVDGTDSNIDHESALRGRGVGIVQMLSDKFDVKVMDDKTVIRVIKNREQ